MANLPRLFTLLTFDTLESTNDEAKRLAEEDALHGTVVWAKEQTAGRGRYGREWISPEENLAISVILRPGHVGVAQTSQLSYVMACAVRKSLVHTLPEKNISVKWPNDVLVEGRKIAGMLLESSVSAGEIDWVVLGLGINNKAHPDDVMFPATSMADQGRSDVRRGDLLQEFLIAFADYYALWEQKGFAPIREDWLAHAAYPGQSVTVRTSKESITGLCQGIDEEGALLLETGGKVRKIHSGDVFPPEGE